MPDRRLRRPILSCSIVVLTFVAASAFGMWVQGAASQLSLVRHTSHSPSASNRAASGQSVVSFKSYAYDANGNMTSATDPMDIPTSYTYDAPTQKVHDFYVVVTGGTGVLVHNVDGPTPESCPTSPSLGTGLNGEFNIINWNGYPSVGTVPQPEGPFRLLDGQG